MAIMLCRPLRGTNFSFPMTHCPDEVALMLEGSCTTKLPGKGGKKVFTRSYFIHRCNLFVQLK